MAGTIGLVTGIVLAGCDLTILGCVYMLIRNQWVYEWQGRFITAAARASSAEIAAGNFNHWPRHYAAIPDYDAMLCRWWVWDASKFGALATVSAPSTEGEG